MSSRAAASRKRLVPGEHSRPSSSKGFFSRSKDSKSAPTSRSAPIDLTEPDAFPLPSTSNLSNSTGDGSQASSPYRANIYMNHDPSARGKIGASTQVVSGSTISSSAYSSHPHGVDDHVSHQAIRLNARSPRGNGPNEYESTFIEASYQPPPPIQATYQPPPPAHSPQVHGQHNTPRSARKHVPVSEEFDSIPPFPAPPIYPPSLPSTPKRNPLPSLPSSTQHLVLLQRSSPTPTELPTYSSVHEIPYSTPTGPNRIPYEVPVNDSQLPHLGRSEYAQHYDPTSYQSPPSPRAQRFTPSPYQNRASSPAHSASSLPNENDFRRPTYRGGGSDGTSTPSSSSLSSYRVSATNPTTLRPPPKSISWSSELESSGNSRSASSPNGPSEASPAFVFPGSRSVARPKASSKIGTPTFKIKGRNKLRMRSSSDASSTSPPLTPSSASSNDGRSPVAPSRAIPRENEQLMVAQQPLNSSSEPALAFSNNLGGRSLNNVVSGAWTAPNSTTVATTNPENPNLANSNTANPPPKMVYPGGRSSAKPSKPPVIKSKKHKQPPSSSGSDEREREQRSRFMGLLKRKKQPKSGSSSSSGNLSQSSSSTSFETNTTPTELGSVFTTNEEDLQNYQPYSADLVNQEAINRAQRVKSRIGSYPLDPHDSVLLDNDRHTGELLARLNPTGSPSFHNYGNTPPTSVLDLGCGQGHWVVDAAIAWRGYGTKVTGYDMVDISRGLLPWAVEQGVKQNIRFINGNFLKQRLPFSDNTFDLVRMSCLALCITSDSWVFLLQEVCRVMMVGGRLELIDDLIFFPYGKASLVLDVSAHSPRQSIPPQLDISIPSSSFTTFSIYDGDVTNPGLGLPVSEEEDEDEEDDFFDLYEVEEEEPGFDDTATLNGREPRAILPPSLSSRRTSRAPRSRASSPAISLRSWNRAHATSGDLEALFNHMLSHKFGIRTDLNDFILDLLRDVFGHAREVRTMHLALAPPETELGDGPLGTRRGTMGLSGSPGLILWPSTFIPMSKSEIGIHASKHLRMLLSCKNFLLEHALEATDDEEIDKQSVLEALWEYEGFLRHRFNPPTPQSSYNANEQDSDAVSVRGSIAESISSDSRDAMLEIQSEFREHFAWQGSTSTSRSPTPKEDTPRINALVPSASSSSSRTVSPVVPSATIRNIHHDADVVSSNSTPLYSRDELTRVRTFRIYEAIKIDEAIFGGAM